MFEDILKKPKFDVNVIYKDLEIYLSFLTYDIMDTTTLNRIVLAVNAYFQGYYGLQTSEVSFDFAHKSVIIEFDNVRLEFPMDN